MTTQEKEVGGIEGDGGLGLPRGSRHRSPSYPAIDLKEAINRARAFHLKEGKNAAPVSVAITNWGYKIDSNGHNSSGARTIAALISFGLMQNEGKSKGRHVRLTPLARSILVYPEGSSEWTTAVRQAAFSPSIHKAMWQTWGRELPSDETMGVKLQLEFVVNPNSVRQIIEEWRNTFSFAKLDEYDIIESKEEEPNSNDALAPEPELFTSLNAVPPVAMTAHPQPTFPSTQVASTITMRDLTFPLIGGGMAVLRVPLPLTDANFNLMMSMLGTMKDAITTPAP